MCARVGEGQQKQRERGAVTMKRDIDYNISKQKKKRRMNEKKTKGG